MNNRSHRLYILKNKTFLNQFKKKKKGKIAEVKIAGPSSNWMRRMRNSGGVRDNTKVLPPSADTQ